MTKIVLSIPDMVALELSDVALEGGFPTSFDMLTAYIMHEVKTHREATRDKLIKAAHPIDLSDVVITQTEKAV
jgi:hypothetical protein